MSITVMPREATNPSVPAVSKPDAWDDALAGADAAPLQNAEAETSSVTSGSGNSAIKKKLIKEFNDAYYNYYQTA
jgi:hypothetical protein